MNKPFSPLAFTPDVTLAERRTLRVIRNLGAPTRAHMARELDVSATAAMRLVDSLTGKGLLREGDKVIDGPGQPSATVMLVPEAAYGIGVSVLTDSFTVTLMDLTGNAVETRTVAHDMAQVDSAIAAIAATTDVCMAERNVLRQAVRGVGLAVPGFFVDDGGALNTPDPIANWSFIDLAAMIEDRLGFPALVENDGNAAAIGEAMVGVGRRCGTFAYLYFADGFGGGVIVDGEPMRGTRGNAGEFAAALVPTGLPKPDLRLLRECIARAGVETANIADMCARFDPDWPGIEAWLIRVTAPVTYVATAISAILDPDVVVLGGRIPKALARMLANRIEIDSGNRRAHGRHVPDLVPYEAEADAVALGAAALVMKAALYA